MEKTEKIIGVIFLILVVTAALWVTRNLSLGERIFAIIPVIISIIIGYALFAFGIGMFFIALSGIRDKEIKKTEKIIYVIYLILFVITFVRALWMTRDLSLRERIVATIGYTFLYSLLFVIATGVLSEIFSSFEWRRFLEKVGEFLKKMRKLKKMQKTITVIPIILVIVILVGGLFAFFKFIKPNIASDTSSNTKEEAIAMLIPYRKGDKWGYCDWNKKIVIPIQYDDAYVFSEGLAAVEINGKWGYIDKKGNMVIPAVYDDVWDFREGLASVEINGKHGFIDTKGNMVIPAVYDDAYVFSEGLAAVEINGKWGFIDTKGNMAIPAMYELALDFSEGLACVEINGKFGCIDKRNIQYWED